MKFIGIIGDMGSGKTNLMTSYLRMSQERDRLVVANYKLKFKHRLMSFKELATLPEDIYGCDVGMDELGVGADSYEFMNGQTRAISKLVTQLRKRQCRVYYTVQRFGMIVKRLREMTDGFILCTDLDASQNHLDPAYVCEGQFLLEFYNSHFEFVNKQIFDGRSTRDLYDSSEIIWE